MPTVSAPIIGLLHPGEMGAAVGHCLVQRGYQVLWASSGRGPQTALRSHDVGLTDVGTVAEVAQKAQIILSICPPHAAQDVADAVTSFDGLYVDANAISPRTAERVAARAASAGATYVDGGIIGPPPISSGSTRLYLSGVAAEPVHALFAGTDLDARVLATGPYAASAIKMAYASWTKGSGALLLTAFALAEAAGIATELQAEWALSQPGLEARLQGATNSAAKKGWRWVAEMEEIAATMSEAGLPTGFHEAAAEVYRRSADAT